MEQSSLHSARKLPQPIRIALERLLGRTLSDNEAISVRAYQPHEAPSPEQQRHLIVNCKATSLGSTREPRTSPIVSGRKSSMKPSEALDLVTGPWGEDHP